MNQPNDVHDRTDSPAHNGRGFFVIGPQMVNPSDVLARLIDAAKLTLEEKHYAPDPHEERRQLVVYRGREAARRRYPAHGPRQLLDLIV